MDILKLALTAGKLKRLLRAGWVREKVSTPESVADHSYRLALLATFFQTNKALDRVKVTKMALVHDLAESEIGDIPTERGNKILPIQKDKLQRERVAMDKIANEVGQDELVPLLDEYNANQTLEAQLVRQLDRLEMVVQAYEYEKEQSIVLEEFFVSGKQSIHDPALIEILEKLEAMR